MNRETLMKKIMGQNSSDAMGENSNFYRPNKKGVNKIRILPVGDDPFQSFYMHYNLGSWAFICKNKTYKEECPVCNYTYDVWKELSKSEQKIVKKIFSQERYYSWVVDLDSEEKDIKIWSYSRTTFEELMSLMFEKNSEGELVEGEYEDITSLKNGVNIKLSFSKKEGELYGAWKVKAERKESNLLEVIPDVEERIKALKPIVEYLDDLSYDKTEELLSAFLKRSFSKNEGSWRERYGVAGSDHATKREEETEEEKEVKNKISEEFKVESYKPQHEDLEDDSDDDLPF